MSSSDRRQALRYLGVAAAGAAGSMAVGSMAAGSMSAGSMAVGSAATATAAPTPEQTQAGYVAVDSYTGTDDERLAQAMSYAQAQTLKPTIVFSARTYTLSSSYAYFSGMRWSGPLGGTENEFGKSCLVRVTGAHLFAAGAVKDTSIQGICFQGNGSNHFQEPITDFANGVIHQDGRFREIGFRQFRTVMHARHLRCSIERMYCNNGTATQFKLAGSDNYYFLEGQSYLSSTVLPATEYYAWFPHMSQTRFGEIYITTETATGVRVDGSYGDFQFVGTKFDCTGRAGADNCQGAQIIITNGRGVHLDRCWFYGGMVNPAATGRTGLDRGLISITGGVDHLITSPKFNFGPFGAPAGTPLVWSSVPVEIAHPQAVSNGVTAVKANAFRGPSIALTAAAPGWSTGPA